MCSRSRKPGDGYSDGRNLVTLVGHRIQHWLELAGDRVDQAGRIASRFGGDRRATNDAAVFANEPDLGVGSADVDRSGEAHQRAALASSGFFQRSIGLAIPPGRKGSAIFLPSPADA